MDMKPGLDGESFKLKLTKDIFLNKKEEHILEVIGEPKIVNIDRFLLTSGEFSQTYNTFKGAKISRSMRKFIDYEISTIKDICYEYEVKILN